jgi:molecular chaperone Hsp33
LVPELKSKAVPVPDSAAAEFDLVQPFLLESSGIRGDLVRLDAVAGHIVTRHAYPGPLAALLVEMLTLTAMLSSMMKYDGVFSLQTSGDGPVRLMVSDMTSMGHLRGYAGFDAERLAAAVEAAAVEAAAVGAAAVDAAAGDVAAGDVAAGDVAAGDVAAGVVKLLGKGHLAYTVDQGPDMERYQGIVALSGTTLADCLQHYFLQSEQIQTGLIVTSGNAGGRWRAAGLILQRLPEESAGRAAAAAPDDDAWRRAMVLQASCTEAELLDPDLPVNDLLYRLFHQEGVRVFQRRPLVARCRCARTRLEETLQSLPRVEIEDLKVDGEVVVTCEYCNRCYHFDDAALARIYAPKPTP